MGYEILETCLLVPGISTKDCSGWVQAWGSILGLAIAIGLPLRMKFAEARERRLHQEAIAHVTAAHVSLMINPIVGSLQAFIACVETQTPQMEPIHFRPLQQQLANIKLPAEHQMHALEPIDSKLAIALARGVAHLEQIRAALLVMVIQGSGGNYDEEVSALLPSARIAQDLFRESASRLNRFVDNVEGPEA